MLPLLKCSSECNWELGQIGGRGQEATLACDTKLQNSEISTAACKYFLNFIKIIIHFSLVYILATLATRNLLRLSKSVAVEWD